MAHLAALLGTPQRGGGKQEEKLGWGGPDQTNRKKGKISKKTQKGRRGAFSQKQEQNLLKDSADKEQGQLLKSLKKKKKKNNSLY